MSRHLVVFLLPLLVIGHSQADDGILGHDGAATARGDLAEGLGKGGVLRSLSAKQLQEAIDKRLCNRKERVEMYYDMKRAQSF